MSKIIREGVLDRFGALTIVGMLILIAILVRDPAKFGMHDIRCVVLGIVFATIAIEGLRTGTAWARTVWNIRRQDHSVAYWTLTIMYVVLALLLLWIGISGRSR